METLSRILDALTEAAQWLDLAGYRDDPAASDDMFDAVIASLTARAVSLGQTLRPSDEQAARALTEGWIRLPSGRLAELTAT